MQVLKKLVIKEWVKAFLASMFIFLLLVTVVNIVSELSRATTTFSDILMHHVLTLPKWLDQMFPVACLTGSLFGLNKLQRRNELMAIFVSGFSRKSFILLICQLGLVISIIQFFFAGYVRPYANSLQGKLLRDGGIHFRGSHGKGIKASTLMSGKIWYKSEKYYSAFTAYDKDREELRDITLFYYNQGGQLQSILKASKAVHMDDHLWNFIDVEHRKNLENSDFPELFSFKEKTVFMTESSDDFKDIQSDIYALSFNDFYLYVQKIKKLGIAAREYETILYSKITSSITSILFALISISAIFYPNRRHNSFGKNIFFVLVFTICYYFMYFTFNALGDSGKLEPIMASVFIPVVCSIYLVLYFYRHRKLA